MQLSVKDEMEIDQSIFHFYALYQMVFYFENIFEKYI